MNNKTVGSATVAFVIGAVAGGIAALLFAPQTGAQTRRRLKRGVQDLRDKGQHLAQEAEDTVRTKAETVAGALKSAASEAKNTHEDEIDRRRQTGSAVTEPKRHGEHETPDLKPRPGRQS